MPQNSYKSADGETKYQDAFHPVTLEAREKLNDAVLSAYDQAVKQSESEAQSNAPVQSM